ncbi:pyruvate-formate lyase [Breznakia sp. PF5-3]|uniref:pyruvate formate lyase family protein n=1 Tax=unclassified Breznakia TaxID=2623764 RepID=UPI002406449B|nr:MULTISPECIES: pyruvate formate lyase family protein [unclassified Breznakia]MDF9825597.1 pyruvate-formate lyase [Breznakia sp. PM6-1]MDF9835852.1 pyruvate-formate lyase [Breznakia sp. PF5-3]MDF9837597.1 pyruvate-formate lyase [Breznakia sp. PFB2-8]MDF9860022.1 pyruvate-formate lyase [Breznakia sp. PH5-24]
MAKINIDGEQNVEVSVQIPSEKTPSEQLAIMEAYTKAHQDSAGLDKAEREINCLKTIFPVLFRSIEEDDLLAGRLDFLPIGFGSVTSIGGVGHYCVFHKLRKFKDELTSEEERQRVDALYEYWQDHDVKAIYCRDVLNDTTTGRFIDCDYPFMATARLSGMMLDYKKLMKYGIPGLIDLISSKPQNAFMQSSIESLKLLKVVIDKQVELVHEAKQDVDAARLADLKLMENDLLYIRDHTPKTFHQALQLFWIYAMVAGVINYGRMDDVLGPYLKRDLDEGRLSEEDAYRYVRSLWKMIENRRTTVNGRIIVGGRGREHVEAADMFTRLCLRVCKDTRYVEPQFTLRIYEETPQDILDMAYDCIGSGATYPTLYNDEVNVPAVEYAMRVDRKTAEQYVPFGCGEFVITAKSVGTPNTLLNLLKIFNITLNDGIDSMDGKRKVPFAVKPLESYVRFDDLYSEYKKVLDYYFDLSIEAQYHSYDVMNKEVSFLFTSILMDDCIERGKALLDGGVLILGGTNETYGNINTSDALYAIKTLVFEQEKYTLKELHDAALVNFEGHAKLRKDLLNAPKYGNDHKACDALANDLFEYVANGIRQRGIDKGMGYYLIVISNNQTNTDWGHKTDASLDGRLRGVFMNPANNPQGGAAKSGPTATLNSLATFKAKYHGGSVQNIKFTPRMFNEDREKIKILFDTYFKKGGCQLMVTVVDHGILEDAQKHPDNYPDLIVRVAGYSAVFVNLTKDIQEELLSRELYD